MKINKNILFFLLSVTLSAMIVGQVVDRYLSPLLINVFAGNDRTMCLNQNLLMTDLAATITGDVSDGDWITLGDGKFQPGNLATVRYQFAQINNISYVPGVNDKLLGFYQLMLISDAPVGGTPQEKKIDEVKITFQAAPPLFCASNINISLNESCSQKVDATMLQPNPIPPYSNYIITLYDPSNNVIPNNTLTKAHVGKEITYKLGHQCTSNTCWGKFRVEDYFAPVFICKNDTIPCTKSTAPDSLGFPFPTGAYIDTIISNKYIVKNWDACSDVTLEYTDEIVKANCALDEDKTITRKWKASDANGNMSTCHQKIVIKRISLASVIFPPHYDGHDKPAFECGDTFPVLANGHPSPDTTGRPIIGHCGNLQFTMTDVKFELCGKSFKIARSWFVIDWCTSLSVTKNQIIVVKDSHGPDILCTDTLQLYTSPYQCATDLVLIPPLQSVFDCSEYSIQHELYTSGGLSANQYLVNQEDKNYFSALPAGIYFLNYVVTDVCNNTSQCLSVIKVSDNIGPNTVCDQVTKVSLDSDGKGRVFAVTFDDGSTDNCGIAGFRVRKMSDLCGFGTQFGDFVDFCCEEIGTTQMVALEVTDFNGNKNTCMVEVVVEDKLKPTITCPPNITLSCTDNYDLNHLDIFGSVVTKVSDIKDVNVYNYYHNGLVGKDGLAKDNCSVTVSNSYVTDIHCFTGTIQRKFIATDSFGLKDSCIQTITILNPNPFSYADITWPVAYESNGCRSDQTDPAVTGKPSFLNTSCATVSSSYEDNRFYIADGACLKIIRTWTVVDWCQFTGTNSVGKWGPYIQIIKLHNTDKPIFTSECRDTTFCSYDETCQTGWVNLKQSAIDSCTYVYDLIWTYELDLFVDGTIDSTGKTNDFSGYLPLGKHKITWRVEDQCGNFNTCSYFFTISDCKKPTPYCISSLTLTLMQESGTIAVWAKDFDIGSSDNCTQSDDLLFTFNGALPVVGLRDQQHYFIDNGILSDESTFKDGLAQLWLPASKSSALFFDCGDIPNGKSTVIPLQMTVTDHLGNQDFCTVELVLQDNTNFCPDLVTEGKIRGKIITENNKIPKNTEVLFEGSEISGIKIINNMNGNFVMDSLPLNVSYTVTPSLNSDPLEGISTIDLIMIQRHILGLATFSSPYLVIAADVNDSKSVTAADLVELRKLILGITERFPKVSSWVFADKSYPFTNIQQPFVYNNSKTTQILTSDIENFDFIAIKMGDVNQSAYNFGNIYTESRIEGSNSFGVSASKEQIGNRLFLTFRAESDIKMDGFQIFVSYNGVSEVLTEDNINISDYLNVSEESFMDKNHVRFLGYSSVPFKIGKGDIIKSFEIHGDFDLSALKLETAKSSEIYNNGLTRKVNLHLMQETINSKPNVRLQTNPVISDLHLIFDNLDFREDIEYKIMASDGQMVVSSKIHKEKSTGEYSIPLPEKMPPGIYFLMLHSDKIDESIRFIRIR